MGEARWGHHHSFRAWEQPSGLGVEGGQGTQQRRPPGRVPKVTAAFHQLQGQRSSSTTERWAQPTSAQPQARQPSETWWQDCTVHVLTPTPAAPRPCPGREARPRLQVWAGRGFGGLKGRGAEHHALFQALRAARTYWLRRARPPGDTGEPPGQAWLLCNEVVHSRVTTRARTVDVGNTAQSLPQTSPH